MRNRKKQLGSTMIELAITSALTVGLLTAVAAVMKTGFDMFASTATPLRADRVANRTLHTIVDQVKHAGRTTILPALALPDGGSSISFRRSTGVVDGVQQFGPPIVIEWQPDPDDPEDGADNDMDGAVDEGIVVMRRNDGEPDEHTTILATGVANFLEGEIDNDVDDNGNQLADERGLSFDIQNGTLTVRMTVILPTVDGPVQVRTVESSVALRN